MTPDELKAALDTARTRMLGDEGGQLSGIRQDSLNRYLGKPDGRERTGYSQYVTREVFEAIEWALPSLLRIFTAGDRVVSLEPVGMEDEPQAEQETDVINHYLLSENKGFITFYEWFKDALTYPNGYAKLWTEEVTTVTTEAYTGLTIDQVTLIEQSGYAELIEATPREVYIETPQGVMPDVVYDIRVKVTCSEPKLRFEAVPPEEVGVDPECSSVSVDEARYVVHKCRRTKSYLLEAGYDPDLLEAVPKADDNDAEDINRNYLTDEQGSEDLDDSTAMYDLEEWYVQIDYDGDGIAERRKVDVIGGEIFENIEYDYQPIVGLSCIPLTHKHAGLSLADVVAPIQELSTFYQRGINDNIARINRPRKYINETAITDDGLTLDQLQDIDSEIIVARDVMGIQPEQHQPVIQDLLAAKTSLDGDTQTRTGIAPNLSLDADVLQQTTAGAFSNAMQAASQRVELIARIFAETGVREAMLKAHRQIKEHQDKAKTLKIRGQWIETNPRDWKDRTNVTVNVGLGFSDKAQQLAAAAQLIQMQMQMMPMGMANPQTMLNGLEDFVEALGRKGVERYFTMPPPPQPQQPDPMFVLAQQELQHRVQKDLKELELKERDHALTEEEKRHKAHLEEMKAQAEIGVKQAQAYKTVEEGKKVDLEIEGVLQGMQVNEHSLRALSELSSHAAQQQHIAQSHSDQFMDTLRTMAAAANNAQKQRIIVRDDAGNIVGTKVVGE